MSRGNARPRVIESDPLLAMAAEGRPGEIQWSEDGQVGVVRRYGGANELYRLDLTASVTNNYTVTVGAQTGAYRTYRIQANTNQRGAILGLSWSAAADKTLAATVDPSSPAGSLILTPAGAEGRNIIFLRAPAGDVTLRLTSSGADTFTISSWVCGQGSDICEAPTAYPWT